MQNNIHVYIYKKTTHKVNVIVEYCIVEFLDISKMLKFSKDSFNIHFLFILHRKVENKK